MRVALADRTRRAWVAYERHDQWDFDGHYIIKQPKSVRSGQSVAFTVTVTGDNPGGTLTFLMGRAYCSRSLLAAALPRLALF